MQESPYRYFRRKRHNDFLEDMSITVIDIYDGSDSTKSQSGL